jgi:hypothetical protein
MMVPSWMFERAPNQLRPPRAGKIGITDVAAADNANNSCFGHYAMSFKNA